MTGLEPWMVSAVGALTPIAKDIAVAVFKEKSKGIFSFLDKDIEQVIKKLTSQALPEYVSRYSDRHCKIKVLGMREPVNLEKVYTNVKFLDEQGIKGLESIETLEQGFRESKWRGFSWQDCPKQEGILVANEKQYLMVLGGPGTGKSTFLRRMGLEALWGKQKQFKHNCIPVLIELKTLTDDKIGIEKLICEEFRIAKFPDHEKFTTKALEKGNLLILLDGLDEVPKENVNRIITEIENFVDCHANNRFIASCRTAAYRSGFKRFSDVAMADFDNSQIAKFINNWFQSEVEQGTGSKCWELLQKKEHKAAKELAHTPLLLTFLCLVYDRSQNFPSNRSVLYGNALRILLEEWAAEKRISGWQVFEGLSTELEEVLLAEIACANFDQDRLFFDKREIVQQIKQFLADNLNAPKHLDGEAVLKAIAIQQGILVGRTEDIYSFSHLTLQEYLTAQYIVDHHQIEALVENHLTEERWQEVFLLVSGMMRGGADLLLVEMEKQAHKLITTDKLRDFLQWADRISTGPFGTYKPAAKRIAAIFLSRTLSRTLNHDLARTLDINRVLALDLNLALARDLALALNLNLNLALSLAINLARALARARARARAHDLAHDLAFAINLALDLALEKSKIYNYVDFTTLSTKLVAMKYEAPKLEQPSEILQTFVDLIFQTWCNALYLDPELLNFSNEEREALNNYLYANLLMVKCRDAAVRVSPQTWAEIEVMMLTGKKRL